MYKAQGFLGVLGARGFCCRACSKTPRAFAPIYKGQGSYSGFRVLEDFGGVHAQNSLGLSPLCIRRKVPRVFYHARPQKNPSNPCALHIGANVREGFACVHAQNLLGHSPHCIRRKSPRGF